MFDLNTSSAVFTRISLKIFLLQHMYVVLVSRWIDAALLIATSSLFVLLLYWWIVLMLMMVTMTFMLHLA